MKRWLPGLAVTLTGLVSITTWLFAAESRGTRPPGGYGAPPAIPAHATPTRATSDAIRNEAFARAAVRLAPDDPFAAPAPMPADDPLAAALVTCEFVTSPPSGTTPKFECALPGGEVVKVKYGRNPEIHAEAAATRLLSRLGWAADSVTIVPRLRCYGCPRLPFMTMRLRTLPLVPYLVPARHDGGYTGFEMVAVERKFPAPAIETDTQEGCGWWELKRSRVDRADIDAFRLLALFLAHWDNKGSNQRLVCLDEQGERGQGRGEDYCSRPLLMIHDLGATFGPSKVNLARWRQAPIWSDAAACQASMRTLPYRGATFSDVQISEGGRQRLLEQLGTLTAADVRAVFAAARFPEYHSSTDDEHDLDEWTSAFMHRVAMIADAGPCPT